MLSPEYIQQNTQIDQGTIRYKLQFFNIELYELDNGRFYLRKDKHTVDTGGFNATIEIYKMGNELYAYFPNSEMQTKVERANMIHSKTVEEFTGFAPSRRYTLENGQAWEQVGDPFSNCTPGGTVLIRDNKLMQVGNWNFKITVRQIQ